MRLSDSGDVSSLQVEPGIGAVKRGAEDRAWQNAKAPASLR